MTEIVRHGDDDRRFASVWRDAQALAKSKLVPKALQDKPHDVLLVLVTGDDLNVPRSQALAQLYPIDGRVVPSAQMQAALARRAGHELRIEETSTERCTVALRRRGTDYWQRVTWTIDDARRAGLLDVWVEQWQKRNDRNFLERYVVGDDRGVDPALVERAPAWAAALVAAVKISRRDNWHRYPDDMLAARTMTRAVKRFCPDALFGLGHDVDLEQLVDDHPSTVDEATVDEDHGSDDLEPVGDDGDEIPDAEVITIVPEPSPGPGSDASPPAAAPDVEDDASLAPSEFRQKFAMRVQRLQLGRPIDDEDRHAVVHYATAGRTRSTREVVNDEITACYQTLRAIEAGDLAIDDVDGHRSVVTATA